MKNKKITITKAAVNHKGKIYTGIRHAHIMKNIREHVAIGEQGFLTSENKFVDRSEAAKIAFKAGQIPGGIYSLDSYQVFPLKKYDK